MDPSVSPGLITERSSWRPLQVSVKHLWPALPQLRSKVKKDTRVQDHRLAPWHRLKPSPSAQAGACSLSHCQSQTICPAANDCLPASAQMDECGSKFGCLSRAGESLNCHLSHWVISLYLFMLPLWLTQALSRFLLTLQHQAIRLSFKCLQSWTLTPMFAPAFKHNPGNPSFSL